MIDLKLVREDPDFQNVGMIHVDNGAGMVGRAALESATASMVAGLTRSIGTGAVSTGQTLFVWSDQAKPFSFAVTDGCTGLSLILIYVVNRQSFHWSMDLSVPWSGLAVFSLALLALAVVTTLVAAREAMSEDAVRVVKDDW